MQHNEILHRDYRPTVTCRVAPPFTCYKRNAGNRSTLENLVLIQHEVAALAPVDIFWNMLTFQMSNSNSGND